MGSIEAQIQLILKGNKDVEKLFDTIAAIQEKVADIQKQADGGILGKANANESTIKRLQNLNRLASDATREGQKGIRAARDQIQLTIDGNAETRKQILLTSQLARERSRVARLSRAFTLETKGLNQTSGELKALKEEFNDVRKALNSAFELRDTQIIAKLRNQLSSLLQDQKEWNRALDGTKNTGVNSDLLKEQAAQYSRQIGLLRERALALADNEEILRKLGAAEYNLVKMRSEDGTFKVSDPQSRYARLNRDADPRLGREQLKNAEKLLITEERLAKVEKERAAFRDESSRYVTTTDQTIRKMQAGGTPAESFKQVNALLDAFKSAVSSGSQDLAEMFQKRIKNAISDLKAEADIQKLISAESEKAAKEASDEASKRLETMERILQIEETIRSFKPISKKAAEEYMLQAALPRLALPFGDPSLPAMRGGARSVGQTIIGGSAVDRVREFLGGSRTQEQADTVFRHIEEKAKKASKVVNESFRQAFEGFLAPDQLSTLDAVFQTLKKLPGMLDEGAAFQKTQDNLRERIGLLDKEAKKLIGRAVLLGSEENVISQLLATEEQLANLRDNAKDPVDPKVLELLNLQLQNVKSILGVEDELARSRDKNAAKEQANQRRTRDEILRTISQLAGLAKQAAAATFDAATFGQGAKIAKGTRNAAIRGGLGLGALGVGGAYTAAQQAMGNIDLGLAQGPITHAAGAIGTAINNAFGGVPEIIGHMLSALGNIPSAMGLAAVAAYALAPAMKTAADAVFLAGQKFGETKFGDSIKLTLERQTNLFESVINAASEMNMTLNASKSGLDQVGQKIKSLPALPMAGQTSFRGETRLVADRETLAAIAAAKARNEAYPGGITAISIGGGARQLKNAEFLATETGKIAARSQESADASLLFAEKLGQAAQEAKTIADYLKEANELRKAGESSTQRFIRENVAAGKRNLQDQATVEAMRDRSKLLVGRPYSLSDVPAGSQLLPGGNTMTAQPQYRQMLNNQAQIKQYVTEILGVMSKQQGTAASIEQLERRTLGNLSEGIAARRSALGFAQQEKITIEQINKENENSIKIIRERNRELTQRPNAQLTPEQRVRAGILDPESLRMSRRARVERGRERQQAIGRATSEGLIGGAFPLLFGQGLGASIGGGLGGAVGGFAGGGLGFGLSLIGTALGSALDGLATAAKDAASSLRDPITNFQKLADAGLFASKSQEQQIKNLIEYGNSAKAAAVIQEELAKKIGVLGMRDMANLDEQSVRLGKAWAELNLQIQAAIAGPLAGLLEWTANMIELFTGGNRREAQRKNFVESLTPAGKIEYNRRKALNLYGATGESEAALQNSLRGQTVPLKQPALKIDPAKQQEEADKLLQENRTKDDQLLQRKRETEDLIRNSQNQTRQFEYQLIDMKRQATDLQRRVNDDMFNKQQQIQRDQISNERLKQQIAIDTVDLQYRKMISNEEGRVAAVLSAEADLVKLRKTNAAEIEVARRNLELDIAKQQRDTQNYIYGLAREADSIRRATLNYEVQIEEYKIATERKIADLRLTTLRQEEDARIKAERGSPVWQGAGGGMAPTGKIVPIGGGHSLDASAAEAFKRMVADAARQGVSISLTSSYRSNAEQAVLYQRYLNGTGNLAAPPGRSGHNRGTSIDVAAGIEWIQKHGAKYGWYNTGMSFPQKERWHFDYKSGTMQPGAPSSTGVAGVDTAIANVQTQTTAIPKGPKIPGVPVSAIRGQMISIDAKDAKIKQEAIALQEKLNGLGEQAALQRILDVAQGEKTIRQKQNELGLAMAEAASIGVMSTNKQEIATFDARALETQRQIKNENEEILKNTKLTGKDKEALATAADKYLQNAIDTLAVERLILTVQQQQRINAEKAGLQMEIQTRGAGLKAGFFGAAAQAYEQKIIQGASPQDAADIARLTRLRDTQNEIVSMRENLAMLKDPTYQVMEGARAIGSAFSDSFKGVVSGSMTAQQSLAAFFQKTSDHFLEMASQMLTQQLILRLIGFGMNLFAPAAGAIGGAGANFQMPGQAFMPTGGYGFAKGGMFTNSIVASPTLFKFANGGALSNGVMGEAGPEAIMPLTRGPGGRLGVDASGSGGAVTVNVSVDAKGTSVEGDNQKSAELGKVIAVAVQQELIKQKRNGGILSR